MGRNQNSIQLEVGNGEMLRATPLICFIAVALSLMPGCTGNPLNTQQEDPVTSTEGGGSGGAAAAVRVSFHYSDYYSLLSPNPKNNCAGDAKTYYDPSVSGKSGWTPFPQSLTQTLVTQKSAFIKDVAVDLTDSNAPVSANNALSCSFGSGPAAPPASNCATFDYGAIGGLPTTLGGSLILIGGVQDASYSGYYPSQASPVHSVSLSCGPTKDALGMVVGATQCSTSLYALGVDTLSAFSAGTAGSASLAPGLGGIAPTGAISTWGNLAAVPAYAGPQGVAGGAASYDPGLQKIYLFAGSAPLPASAATGPSSDTLRTWQFDLKALSWTLLNSDAFVTNGIQLLTDFSSSPNDPHPHLLGKSIGARSLFGYVAVPAFSLSHMGTDRTVLPDNLDTSDRIVAVGGLGADESATRSSYKFNPTFGPEWVDALGIQKATTADGTLVQYLDSYHTQILNNNSSGSQFAPDSDLTPGAKNHSYSFGSASVRRLSASGLLLNGYAIMAGGFDPAFAKITTGNATGGIGGGTGVTHPLYYSGASTDSAGASTPSADAFTANFTRQPNFPNGSALAEGHWTPFGQILDYGASTLLPGFSLKQNDLAYFGGTTCRDYLSDSALAATDCDFANPGKYFSVPSGGLDSKDRPDGVLTQKAWSGSPPHRAGMASARGEDAVGNVIIVSWGGMSAPLIAEDPKIYVLYNNGARDSTTGLHNPDLASPTWITVNADSSGDQPVPLANASLVYSHVTRSFYLFGGYRTSGGVSATVGDTWQLSISGECPSCRFQWKKLNIDGALTCYPGCPEARRSHRMIEVNYSARLPVNGDTGTLDPKTLEPDCSHASSPCSFALFMEGGSPDGITNLGNRWMFDPTANAGVGHWQRVDGFPPRHLASIASIDFDVPGQAVAAHRTLLFGGETMLQNPQMAARKPTRTSGGVSQYFVPATLGDTYLYDTDGNAWNRAGLLGKGYSKNIPAGLTEFERRQAYIVNANGATGFWLPFVDRTNPLRFQRNEISELSPPAISGAVMITRRFPSPIQDASAPVPLLKIPEIYLLGGRTKDGRYNTLDHVYKFCAGSPGERPPVSPTDPYDNAACDAYGSVSNPASSSPTSEFVGRWLRKVPKERQLAPSAPTGPGYDLTPSTQGSFMGAGAYDPDHDKLIIYGGLTPVGGAKAVTDSHLAGSQLLEYTPPQKNYIPPSATAAAYAQGQGYWTAVPSCTDYDEALNPTGRYGHTMSYDELNHQLIVVGGLDADGSPLTQSQTYYDGRNYQIPEVLTARRILAPGPVGPDGPTIPSSSPFPCYHWARKTVFGNSLDIATQSPPQTGLSFAAGVYVPASGYNTGYYSTFDRSCAKAGPIASDDPETNKLMAGGAYIDLDRSQLGPNENVLLNLTFMPLGPLNRRPDGAQYDDQEKALIKIHLIRTGLSLDAILGSFQPRHLTFSSPDQYPEVVQSLSVFSEPTGSVRQEQVLIPLSSDPSIDRIRIERYSGSMILIDAAVHRMGYR